MMRTTVAFHGVTELILDKAVNVGLARSKTEALRLGVFALNREYLLVKDVEEELVKNKLKLERQEMRDTGEEYLTKDEALSKYG